MLVEVDTIGLIDEVDTVETAFADVVVDGCLGVEAVAFEVMEAVIFEVVCKFVCFSEFGLFNDRSTRIDQREEI